jgi:hypothetical protein
MRNEKEAGDRRQGDRRRIGKETWAGVLEKLGTEMAKGKREAGRIRA